MNRMRLMVCLAIPALVSCSGPSSSSPPSLAGDWADSVEEPLGMYMTLQEDHHFVMGDIDGGQRYPGLSGTWTTREDRLALKVDATDSDKIREGEVKEFQFHFCGDGRMELSSPPGENKRTFTRSP